MTLYDWCIENNKEGLLDDWDVIKNGNLTPKEVSKASNKLVCWKCSTCGYEWQARVNWRYGGGGCRVCGYKRVSKSRRIPKPGHSLAERAPELINEWHSERNGELTPDKVPYQSSQSVWWLGPCGHEWQAVVSGRSNGNGCPICANLKVLEGFNDLATIRPELAKEWHPTRNHPLTPKDVVAKANRKVWWKCGTCGHEWEAVITKRAYGQGCPGCAKGFQTSFPEKAIAYYLLKNGLEIVENYQADWLSPFELDIYIPSLRIGIEYDGSLWHQNAERDVRKNSICYRNGIDVIRIREAECVKIIDPIGLYYYMKDSGLQSLNEAIEFILGILGIRYGIHESSTMGIDVARDRMEIYGLMELRERDNSFASVCPELVNEWHGERNGLLKPADVTPFSDKKVWWKCLDYGHEWEAVVKSRTKGRGCPICSGNRVLVGFNDLATVAPNLVAEWYEEKNYPLTPQNVTAQSGRKVWWRCAVCGCEWQAAIYSRNGNGKGCPECGKHRVHEKLRTPKPGQSIPEKAPALLKEWHPTKNGALSPNDVACGAHRRVWWLCAEGHEWEAPVYSRVAGNGCPRCYQKRRKA